MLASKEKYLPLEVKGEEKKLEDGIDEEIQKEEGEIDMDTDDSEFELEGLDDIDLIDERKIKKLVKSEETILEELGHL